MYDGDGYGLLLDEIRRCVAPTGYTENSEDCDDNNALTFPNALECYDGVDNDCDGLLDWEDDSLSWDIETCCDLYQTMTFCASVALLPSSGSAIPFENYDWQERQRRRIENSLELALHSMKKPRKTSKSMLSTEKMSIIALLS